MNIKENFKFIKQHQEGIIQNLIAIFEDHIATKKSIIIGWYDKKFEYREASVNVIQINEVSKYFIVRYRLNDKICYKAIPFKYIDMDSFEFVDTYKTLKLIPAELKFDLLVNFHEIR